jgi:uncharacterized protein YjiS (DUF1127 family)
MAYITVGPSSAGTTSLVAGLRERIATARESFATYRRKRAIYRRTLRELQSYRQHELIDLGIQSGDIETLARKQAGW